MSAGKAGGCCDTQILLLPRCLSTGDRRPPCARAHRRLCKRQVAFLDKLTRGDDGVVRAKDFGLAVCATESLNSIVQIGQAEMAVWCASIL